MVIQPKRLRKKLLQTQCTTQLLEISISWSRIRSLMFNYREQPLPLVSSQAINYSRQMLAIVALS